MTERKCLQKMKKKKEREKKKNKTTRKIPDYSKQREGPFSFTTT